MDPKLESMNVHIKELQKRHIESVDHIARMEATLAAWSVNIERFWALHMPKFENSVDRLANSLDLLSHDIASLREELHNKVDKVKDEIEPRLRALEVESATTKVRVGLWGGLAGLAAIAWQVVTTIWK